MRSYGWDPWQRRNVLIQHGVNLPPRIEITTTTVVAETPMETTHQTCSVCYDGQELNGLITTTCPHINQSVCNICLFRHIQQGIQITFIGDIHCFELKCGVDLTISYSERYPRTR